jgi:predicted Zn-dependent peptidase
MKGQVTLAECQVCNQVFVEDFDACLYQMYEKRNGAYSVESRSLRHHGKALTLLGYAMDARSSCNKLKDSSRK